MSYSDGTKCPTEQGHTGNHCLESLSMLFLYPLSSHTVAQQFSFYFYMHLYGGLIIIFRFKKGFITNLSFTGMTVIWSTSLLMFCRWTWARFSCAVTAESNLEQKKNAWEVVPLFKEEPSEALSELITSLNLYAISGKTTNFSMEKLQGLICFVI